MRILIIGGTGGVASQLLTQLAALPEPPTIRASTRSPQPSTFPSNVEVAAADLTDPSTFPALFAGVDRAFAYVTHDSKYTELAEAAKAAGVQRIVVLSSVSVQDEPDSRIGAYHKRAEDAVRASGIQYTFIRAGFFHSNFHFIMDRQLATGEIELPYPEARLVPVAEEDLAAVALTALTTDQLVDQAVVVTGPQSIDFAGEVAAISKVREAAGKRPLVVKKLSEDEWVSKYSAVFPPGLAKILAAHWAEMVSKKPSVEGSERLTGRPGTTIEQWVANRKDDWVKAGEK